MIPSADQDPAETNDWVHSSVKPELWSEEQLHYTSDEWAEIERSEHDIRYAEAFPFGLNTYKFTPEHVLWYEDYAYKKGRRPDRGHRTRKVFDLIDLPSLAGKKVLDIGCGIGQYAVFLAMHGAEVTGIELSPVAIDIAAKMAHLNGVGDQCNFIAGDFTRVGLVDESYDIVLLHEVYHHLIKYTGAKEKILQLTKKGGKIILADTVRGGGPINLGRRLTKYLRYKIKPEARAHEIEAGDVQITLNDYRELGQNGTSYTIHSMSYLYMIKQTALQYHTNKAVVRWFLHLVKLSDDLLLALFPFLKKQCGEAVLCIVK